MAGGGARRLRHRKDPGGARHRRVLPRRSADLPLKMQLGTTFTIEPVLTEGSAEWITWDDGWTVATSDGKRAAQFEHTVLITEGGCEVLT
eukprot:Skav215469  [mRNA]  locus=scaffold1089:716617:718309:- [translate_table: standard]